MLAACLIVTGFIPVDRVVTMQGKVISEVPTQVVQPLDVAIVRSIDVHEGQKVQRASCWPSSIRPWRPPTSSALKAQVSTYSAQVARMRAEVNNQPFSYTGTDRDMALQAAIYAQRKAQYEYTLENYKQQIDGLVSLIARSEADAVGYRDRLVVAQNLEGMRKELQRLQVGSRLNTLAAEDNRAEMARNLANAEQTAEQRQEPMSPPWSPRATPSSNSGRPTSANSSPTRPPSCRTRAESLRKAELHRKLVELRADRDATVLTVAKVSVGSVLQAGQQFFTLMPSDTPLAVEGILSGSEGGFVHLGDPVSIKFDTFDYMHYGMAYGTVRSLSADTFYSGDPQAAQASAGAVAGRPRYDHGFLSRADQHRSRGPARRAGQLPGHAGHDGHRRHQGRQAHRAGILHKPDRSDRD